MRQLKITIGIGLAYHCWRCFYSSSALVLFLFSMLFKMPHHYVGSLSFHSLKANVLGPVPRHWRVSTCIHNVKCTLCCFKAEGYRRRQWEDLSLFGDCFIFLTVAFVSACSTGRSVSLQLLARMSSVFWRTGTSALCRPRCSVLVLW